MALMTPAIWEKYRIQLKEILVFLPEFAKSPIHRMKRLPHWEWPTIITLHTAFAALVGFFVGLQKPKFGLILWSIFGSITSALLIGFLGAAFFYYFFFFALNRKENFLALYTMVVVASLPMFALRILGAWATPINLIGFGAMCLLCTVGLVELFRLARPHALKLMGTVFVAFSVFWVVDFLQKSRSEVETRQQVTPESLDILQKELGKPLPSDE